jgi:glucosyl-3-phosphoglycerate synthase
MSPTARVESVAAMRAGTPSIPVFDPGHYDVARAIADKQGRTVSMCIPCRNEEATIGDVVGRFVPILGSLLDELIVIDDGSTDDTAGCAAAAGATVIPIEDVHARFGSGRGKGNVLWASLAVTSGDFVVWCDGDVTSATPDWVARLLSPMFADPAVSLVKACYDRPTDGGGGGRTTELVARPLLSLFAPSLATLHQPLAGETAGRRRALEQVPFVQGWGVEIALLHDMAALFGVESIAQVDLGTRIHRHQALNSLSVQAAEVMATLLQRLGKLDDETARLFRIDATVDLNLCQRPPFASVVNANPSL